MADPFANLLVRINDRPIYCMGVKGALSPGNWVLFKSSGIEEEDGTIGLILSTADDGNSMEVNIFRRVTPALSQALKLPKFNNPRYQHIPQILRTASRERVNVFEDVKSICWVFQRSTLDSSPYEGHQGMKNLFLLEFNYEGGRTHIWDCHPFCSGHGHYKIFALECYQERVWNGLQILRAEICRHLGRYSEKQGSFTRVSSQVVMGRESWEYLVSNVEGHTRASTERNGFMSKRVLEPGLLLKTQRTPYISTLVRFETVSELRALSAVLGELVTMEVRKRKPKYTIVESLFVNDIINVVAGSQTREEPFRVRTVMQGIDFLHDGSKVRIRMRYSRYQYMLPLAEGSPSTILTRAIRRKRLLDPGDEDSSEDEEYDEGVVLPAVAQASVVVIGRQFDHLGRVYEVSRINMEGETVAAKVIWPAYLNQRVDEFEFHNVVIWIRHRLAQEDG